MKKLVNTSCFESEFLQLRCRDGAHLNDCACEAVVIAVTRGVNVKFDHDSEEYCVDLIKLLETVLQ